MASNDGFLTEEQRRLLRSASEGRDSASSLVLSKSPRSEQEHHAKHNAGSAKNAGGTSGKYEKRSHSGKIGRPKKDGRGGKGTWGGILDTDGDLHVDRNDPNYDSEENNYKIQRYRIHTSCLYIQIRIPSGQMRRGDTLGCAQEAHPHLVDASGCAVKCIHRCKGG